MVQHFKNKSCRLSWKLGEDVLEHYRNYEVASNDYKLSVEQKLAYLHSFFKRKSKQYYHSTSFSKIKRYEHANENIIKLCCARKRRVRVR